MNYGVLFIIFFIIIGSAVFFPNFFIVIVVSLSVILILSYIVKMLIKKSNRLDNRGFDDFKPSNKKSKIYIIAFVGIIFVLGTLFVIFLFNNSYLPISSSKQNYRIGLLSAECIGSSIEIIVTNDDKEPVPTSEIKIFVDDIEKNENFVFEKDLIPPRGSSLAEDSVSNYNLGKHTVRTSFWDNRDTIEVNCG